VIDWLTDRLDVAWGMRIIGIYLTVASEMFRFWFTLN